MKNVIVTGASRGIGKSIACLLAKNGYDLFLIAKKSGDELQKIKKDLTEKYGVKVDAALCDVSDPDAVMDVFRPYVEKNGVYALINNAGISSVGLVTDLSASEFADIINVNLNSCFYTSKAVLPSMIGQKDGRIINISSIWGNVGASTEVAYSASKGGVNAFTRALAKELAPSNIPVNAIAFGVIDTSMNAHLSAEEKKDLCESIPMDRMADPDEAALMVLKILESPSYLTGQVITMDGGFT